MDILFAAPVGALLIFLLRVVDVSMAVLRMILAVKGHRVAAAFLGFFEVLIWLIAVGHALKHLDSVYHVLGYAGGFAAGNFVGVWLEGRFALGLAVVRAVCRNEPEYGGRVGAKVAAGLRSDGYAVTEMLGRGRDGEVDILNIVVKRKRIPEVVRAVELGDPDAFITVEEIRDTHRGYIASRSRAWSPGGRKAPALTSV